MKLFLEDLKVNDNYKVVIRGGNWTVRAILEDNFSPAFGAEWSSAFEKARSKLESNTLVQVIKGGMEAFDRGGALKSQFLSRVRWDGSSHPVFVLNLSFIAIREPKKEVMEPLKTLIANLYPESGGKNTDSDKNIIKDLGGMEDFLVIPPGTYNGSKEEGRISLEIGNWFSVQKYLLMKSVTPVFSRAVTKEGYPIWGTARVEFQTFQVPFREEIERWFKI